MSKQNDNRPRGRSGVDGFSPLAGHGKDGVSNTSSFGAGPPDYTLPGYPSSKQAAGLEEHGKKRLPTSGIVGRVLDSDKNE